MPEVPDGNVASTEQLSAAGKAVRAFASTMQGQLDCLDDVQASLGDEIAQDERLRADQQAKGRWVVDSL